jgi:hypothetical protein
LTLEVEYLFKTTDWIFLKQISPQIPKPLRRISQDPEPDPESALSDPELKDPSTTTSVQTRILGEDTVSDQY